MPPALCVDEVGIERARRFFDEIGITRLPLYWSVSLRVHLAFAFIGLPTTLLIGRAGLELGRVQGPADWESDDAIAQLESLIAAPT